MDRMLTPLRVSEWHNLRSSLKPDLNRQKLRNRYRKFTIDQ
eukprot:XP_001706865.1 Hypothetical protein GL50803_7232 [Giardia lamblia ATCC 50803]